VVKEVRAFLSWITSILVHFVSLIDLAMCPHTDNPFDDCHFSFELAKLLEHDLSPDTVNSKLRLPKLTLMNAKAKTKDRVVINAYQFDQWYRRGGKIYTIEDLEKKFGEDLDVKEKIQRLW